MLGTEIRGNIRRTSEFVGSKVVSITLLHRIGGFTGSVAIYMRKVVDRRSRIVDTTLGADKISIKLVRDAPVDSLTTGVPN